MARRNVVLVTVLAGAALLLGAATANADENGHAAVEKRCFKPAKLFSDGSVIDPRVVGDPCTCGGEGEPSCDDPSLCPEGLRCGDCEFLDQIVELIVRGINKLCDAPPGEKCIEVTSTCQRISQEVFAGTTLASPGGPDWACEVGGRGEVIGDAAMCLLRDLALPSVLIEPLPAATDPAPIPTPPLLNGVPGTDARASIDLGIFGDTEVRQRLKFRSYDPATRTFAGYHDVKLCLPVLGCIDHEVQNFTAQLIHTGPSAPAACGDFAVQQAYALALTADDNEHRLEFNIPPITVDTPVGPFEFQPIAKFETFLKNVLSPYHRACAGGTNAGRNCVNASECPGGACRSDQLRCAGSANAGAACNTPADCPGGDCVSRHDDLAFTDEAGCTAPSCTPPGFIEGGKGYFASLHDRYGRNPGTLATTNASRIARGGWSAGWSSQAGLGGRNAGQGDDRLDSSDDELWNPSERRPDLRLGLDPDEDACTMCTPESDGCDDPRRARDAEENMPAGNAYAALNVDYSFKHLVEDLFSVPPLDRIQVKDALIRVRPEVGTTFASQLNLFFSEGVYETDPPEFASCKDHDPRSIAQVRFPNGAAARAFFDIFVALKFKLRLDLGFLGTHTIVNLHPKKQITIAEEERFSRGPEAMARSEVVLAAGAQPTLADPIYSQFLSFSGRTDGDAFVRECLEQPAPPEQPVPTPAYTPGDPDVLANAAAYPCNFCIAIGGSYLGCEIEEGRPGDCVPSCATADVTGHCPPGEGSCVHVVPSDDENAEADDIPDGHDEYCIPRTSSTADAGFGFVAEMQNPTAQPPGKEWRCDDPAKLGCFDLCRYDATAAQPYTVIEQGSALDRDPRCGGAPTSIECGVDADCDDHNPCTDDVCSGAGDVGCLHTPNAAPCDDHLVCTGADRCANGSCQAHEGNPCFGNPVSSSRCDEAAEGCGAPIGSERCDNGVDDNGDALVDCADPLCATEACQCQPIGRDPGSIRFADVVAPDDSLNVHGTITPCAERPFDPATEPGTVTLSNAAGIIYQAALPAGALERRGKHRFSFRDPTARRNRSGLYRLEIRNRPRFGVHRFRLVSYGDLSGATDPTMTLQLAIGGQTFVNTSMWKQTAYGWSLTLPGE